MSTLFFEASHQVSSRICKLDRPVLTNPYGGVQNDMHQSQCSNDRAKATTEPSWHAAYPAPRKGDPASITRTQLLHCLDAGQQPGKDFLLVDLRRTDFEVRFPHVIFFNATTSPPSEALLKRRIR